MVKFTSLDEFMNELDQDRGKIDRNILRITSIVKMEERNPVLYLVVSAKVVGEVICLELYVGKTGEPFWSKNVESVTKEIKKYYAGILDIRKGAFEQG